ncbi:unnamed protein product [Schistosoma margrebowiei]|uniref:Uncharacterized protein n=1 Tax=Schistosoma margrebowiei TaxID=48269 RepID=A0A183LDP8_9TREM|nr:unnamed protein product [Schistosoma margrebowiei]
MANNQFNCKFTFHLPLNHNVMSIIKECTHVEIATLTTTTATLTTTTTTTATTTTTTTTITTTSVFEHMKYII